MVLDLIVSKTNDGYTGEIPSISGCESWAHTEDEVIEKTIELLYFYVSLDPDTELIVDKARRMGNKTVYKLVFDKNN